MSKETQARTSDAHAETPDSSDDGWSREELQIHADGARALIRAVVKQWILDGRPKGDDIQLWIDLMSAVKHDKE